MSRLSARGSVTRGAYPSRYLAALKKSALGVNADGHLTIEDWDVAKLARKFGTPLWVVSESTVRSNARALLEAFSTRYPRFTAAYGTKANHSPSITKIMLQEGAWVDCVSLTQLRLAAMAGAPPEKTIFNGNNKTEEELEFAIRSDVGLVNIDSGDELEMIEGISRRLHKRPSVNVRIRGGYSDLAESDPSFVRASTEGDKFGVDVPSGQALEICRSAMRSKNVRLVGVHHHIGWSAYGIPYSSTFDLERVRGETREVVRFANELHSKLGFSVSILDFGGGFRKVRPHPFGPGKVISIPEIGEYADAITSVLQAELDPAIGQPHLIVEPGGYMVSDVVTLLSSVGNIKEVKEGPGAGKWVAVDSSAYMFVRKLIFNFYHHALPATKMDEPREEVVDIVGNTCATDYIADKVEMPPLRRGDLIATLDQGSYCEMISSEYCGIPRPATVLVNGKNAAVIRRRETPEDMISVFGVPDWIELGGSNGGSSELVSARVRNRGR